MFCGPEPDALHDGALRGLKRTTSRSSCRGRASAARFVVALLFGWVLAGGGAGIGGSLQAATVFSRSGQFVIHSPYTTTPTLSQFPAGTNSGRITLAPDPLAVSCERIKTGVLRELDAPDQWRGKVQVWIRSRLRAGMPPGFVSTRYADGWQYTLEFPEEIEASALVRAVVLAVLTEMANRHATQRPAEVPLWLVDGLAARITSLVGPDPVVSPTPLDARLAQSLGQLAAAPKTRVGAENLSEIRAWIQGRRALTFAELSQPPPALLVDEVYTTYRYSAQLLVAQLQNLRQGRRCLQAMVFGLGRSLNWQTAFLQAFGQHFERLLDVEKWWTVATQSFVQGDQPNSWPRSVSLAKLADALQVRVDVQERAGGPRRPGALPLQEFIGRTTFAGHREAVRLRIRRLEALERTAAPDTVPLVRNYRSALEDYLTQRLSSGRSTISKRVGALPPAFLVREARRRLEELDRQRDQLARVPEVPSVSAVTGETRP